MLSAERPPLITRCSECGGTDLPFEDVVAEIEIGSGSSLRRYRATTKEQRCLTCGETGRWLYDIAETEHKIAAHLISIGASDGEALRYVRKAAGLHRAEIAAAWRVDELHVKAAEDGEVSTTLPQRFILYMLAAEGIGITVSPKATLVALMATPSQRALTTSPPTVTL